MKEKLLQMDITGTLAIVASVVCYLFALQWGGITKSWSSSDVIGTLVGFGVITVLFILNEYLLGERALILPNVAKNRMLATGCVFTFL